MTDNSRVKICHKCGSYYIADINDEIKCKICNEKMLNTNFTFDDYCIALNSDKEQDFLQRIRNRYVINSPVFDKNMYDEVIDKEYIDDMKVESIMNGINNTHDAIIPHCPTCGSTNVQKISRTKRVASILGFGILSKNIGKTFECRSCGYKW